MAAFGHNILSKYQLQNVSKANSKYKSKIFKNFTKSGHADND